MMIVAPLTPSIIARIGHNRTVGLGMSLVSIAFLLFTQLTTHSPYAYILLCVGFLVPGIAMTMSPMTASIMSAVPPRRAGAGSAMTVATRELGAALGVAVLGSVAASRYSSGLESVLQSLSPADQHTASSSLAGAISTAAHLPAQAAAELTHTAETAFVSGIHLASIVGAVLAAVAAIIVLRFLPRQIPQHGAELDVIESLEDAAQLGLAGVPPIFAESHSAELEPEAAGPD
jgi:hypothetical protein